MRAADRAVARTKARVAAALGEVPGVAVREVPEGVAIEGHGLARRLIEEPRLRHVAGWLR